MQGMKVWVVHRIDSDDDVYTFIHSYQSHNNAVQAIEKHARHVRLEWNDAMNEASAKGNVYYITETELQ
jgi:hypothetical protein